MTPSTKPSCNAYAGAVIGDHCILNTVTYATARAPKAQANAASARPRGSRALSNLLQAQSALIVTQRRSRPARWIVPLSVIVRAPPTPAGVSGINILRSNGFLVSIG